MKSRAALPPCFEEGLTGVVARINAHVATCTDGFWFMTDPHFPKNAGHAGAMIAELAGKVPLDKVFCGGDIPYAYVADGKTSCREELRRNCEEFGKTFVEPVVHAGLRAYMVRGNHDFTICRDTTFQTGTTLSGEETRRWILGEFTDRGVVANDADPEACCYYFDNPDARIRYIAADTTDSAESGDIAWGVRTGMREPQLRWLAETALGTLGDGWNAVLIHHAPMAGLVGTDADERVYADFRHICEAYQNRTVTDICGKRYDFAEAKGRILLSLSGHHHAERQTFQNGILHVTEPCDMLDSGIDYKFGAGPWCGDLPTRKEGGPYEHTFDAVQLDTERGLVHFTRVGGGQDRTIHLEPLRLRAGGRLSLEARHLAGPVTWGSHDADGIDWRTNPISKWCPIAVFRNECTSVTPDGEFHGIRHGEAVAIAMDGCLNKEIWPVTVEA